MQGTISQADRSEWQMRSGGTGRSKGGRPGVVGSREAGKEMQRAF